MASPELQQLVGHAFIDEQFFIQWSNNPREINHRHNVKEVENDEANTYIRKLTEYYDSQQRSSGNSEVSARQATEVTEQIKESGQDVQDFALQILKDTISKSQSTFRNISFMSYIIFGLGIVFFAASAASGLVSGNPAFAATFGALGVINFVAFFIFEPSKMMQIALSNLLQFEIIFMNFWNQMHFWTSYGLNAEERLKQEGSKKLQELSYQNLKLLEEYLEWRSKEDPTTRLLKLGRISGHGRAPITDVRDVPSEGS